MGLPDWTTRMEHYVESVIRRALADAWAEGKDHVGQTEAAVRAFLRVRPDMTASDARTMVNRLRDS